MVCIRICDKALTVAPKEVIGKCFKKWKAASLYYKVSKGDDFELYGTFLLCEVLRNLAKKNQSSGTLKPYIAY